MTEELSGPCFLGHRDLWQNFWWLLYHIPVHALSWRLSSLRNTYLTLGRSASGVSCEFLALYEPADESPGGRFVCSLTREMSFNDWTSEAGFITTSSNLLIFKAFRALSRWLRCSFLLLLNGSVAIFPLSRLSFSSVCSYYCLPRRNIPH